MAKCCIVPVHEKQNRALRLYSSRYSLVVKDATYRGSFHWDAELLYVCPSNAMNSCSHGDSDLSNNLLPEYRLGHGGQCII